MPETKPEPLADKWRDDDARGLSEPELLLYRSNLLGAEAHLALSTDDEDATILKMPPWLLNSAP